MKKRVILVHPKTEKNRSITYPLSSLALAATLEKEGFVPVIIDMEVEQNYLDLLTRHLDEALLVGISAMTDWQIKYGLELCDFVRDREPNLPIVWGGWHPTTLPVQTARDARIDIVVRGEGDLVVVELARALQGKIPLSEVKGITYKMGGTIENNADADPIRDLNVLPYTPWHLIDIQTYIKKYGERTLCVQAGRGCPYTCTFCSHKVMPNRTPRPFSAQYIFDNIAHIIREFDITHVRFYEPTFISSRKRAREVCQEIQRQKLSISWEGSARINVVARFDKNLFTILNQSGCVQLNLGFESGSQRVLNRINKKVTIQDALQSVTRCEAHDIAVEAYFVREFPSETVRDMLDTDKMILGIKRLAPRSELSTGFYTAFPGTPIYRECVEKYGLKERTTLQEWGEVSSWVNDRPWLSRTRKLWEHMVNRATHYRLTRTILHLSLPYLRSLFLFVSQLKKKWHNLVSAMQPRRRNDNRVQNTYGHDLKAFICRTPYYVKLFFLNPFFFFQKVYVRIFLKVMPSPKGVVPANIGGYTIKVVPSKSALQKSMYFGYYEVEVAYNIKRHLTIGGIFIDVGAGNGYFSAIASDIVGAPGQVHCFEPLSSGAKAIQEMIGSNANSNIVLNNYALGVDDGVHNYYMRRYGNGTAFSMMENVCLLKKDNVIGGVDQVIEVRTQRLDTYLEQRNMDEVSLIKIDVEGYEYFVLRGLAGFFERATHKPPIICEIFAPAYEKTYLSEFHDYMKDRGYQAYNIFNPRMSVEIRLLNDITNVVFRSVK